MPGFLKTYPDARRAAEALRRTRVLRGQSVPTPDAWPGPAATELVFDRIEGRSGAALVAGPKPALLRAVSALHAAEVTGLGVFDPLLRVRDRLGLTDVPMLRAIAEGGVPRGSSVLHGDLHVGQFVVTDAGTVWLVDLDDLAMGPPEADIANFAAHLATTRPTKGISATVAEVRGAWGCLGQPLDGSVFERFLELALLRRHLKLREAGRPDFEADICAYLRESASFSIR